MLKKSAQQAAIHDMMKKAITTNSKFYSNQKAVEGYRDHKDNIRAQRKEQKNTLSQWYGMKKCNLGDDEKQELELLQYRNFLNPELQHQAPKKANGVSTEFVEFGYFAGTGRNKRKKYKSFADEWIEEHPEFADVVTKRIKQNVKLSKKAKLLAVKRQANEAAREKSRKESKRKSKHDMF